MPHICKIKANIHKFTAHYDTHSYPTRHNNNIDLNYLRLTKSMNGVNFYGPKFYNKLPTHIRNLDMKRFKSKVQRFLIAKAYYQISEFFEDSMIDDF